MNDKTKKPVADATESRDAYKVEILSPGGPRRRAGMDFGPTPTIVAVNKLDEAARKAIEADPLLTVRPHRPEPIAPPADDPQA